MPGDVEVSWDFFVSFAGPDRAWADWVVGVLQGAGYRVFWQGQDFVPGSEWPRRMEDGVRHSRHTIALLSPRYLTSTHAKTEWRMARQAARLVPVLTAPVDPPDDDADIAGVGSLTWIDLVGLTEPVARATLLDGVDATRRGERRYPGAVAFPGSAPAAGHAGANGTASPYPPRLPPVRNRWPDRLPLFSWREEILIDMARRSGAAPAAPAIIVVHGMPGVGKSALAVEYAHRHGGGSRIAWWVDAADPLVARNQVADLASALDIDRPPGADLCARALHALSGRDRWLLVLDNVEPGAVEPGAVADLRTLIPAGGDGVVIITSRSDRVLPPGIAATIEVPPFTREESVGFLRRRFGSDEAGSPDESDGETFTRLAGQVARRLGGLPLALDQAAWRRISLARYLQQLERDAARLLSLDGADGYGRSVHAAFAAAIESLDDADAPRAMLGMLGALAPGPVPLDLFLAAADDLDGPLARSAASALTLDDTVAVLLGQGLVRRDGNNLSIHQVTRVIEAATVSAMPDRATQAALRMLYSLALAPIEHEPRTWPWWGQLLPHVLALARAPVSRTAVMPGDDLPAAVTLLDRAASYLGLRGDHSGAVDLRRDALGITVEHHAGTAAPVGAGDPTAVVALAGRRNNLAAALLPHGRADEALSLLRDALAGIEPLLGVHPLVAETLNNMASAYRDLQEPQAALTALTRAINIMEQLYGDTSPELLRYLTNQALVLHELARPLAGLRQIERATDIAEQAGLTVTDDPETADRFSINGALLFALGRTVEARDLFTRALAITEARYAPGDPRTDLARRNVERAGGRSDEQL
jgi:tetratricopeptide (TPR) repeat protein